MLALLHFVPVVGSFMLLTCKATHPIAYLALAFLAIKLVALLFHSSKLKESGQMVALNVQCSMFNP